MKRLMGVLLAVLLMPVPASAALLTVNFAGSLYQVSSSVSSRFTLGDAVTAQLVIDTAVAGTPFYPGTTYLFPGAVVGGFVNVDGYVATLGSGARAFVTDDEDYGSGPIDRLIVDDYSAAAADVAGLPFNDLFFNWQDNGGTATPGFVLPDGQAALDAYGAPTGAIDWATSDGANRVTFAFSSVTVGAPVPEPASWAMMIAGFAATGVALRRRRAPALA